MANTRKVQVVTPRAASPAYDDAARQRALADALQQRALAPRDMSNLQGKDPYLAGLTQLGEALLARYAGKNAAKAEAGADSQMRDVNAQAIEKLAGAYQIEGLDGEPAQPLLGGSLPGSQIDTALKGMDPRQANQVVSQALLAKAMPAPEEAYTLSEGQKRLVGDRVIADNPKPEAPVEQNWETQEQVLPDGRIQLMSYDKKSNKWTKQGEPYKPIDKNPNVTTPPAPKPADLTKSNQKVAAIEAAKVALARVQATSNTLGSGGGFIEGRLPAMGEKTQDFDGAVAQLLAALQSAIRVPGIGSQSNMELQALMEALPQRKQEKKVRDNQITGIAQRLEEILSREAAVQDGAPGAPAATTQPAKVEEWVRDANGKLVRKQ